MHFSVNKAKNILLVLLIGFSIYQTAELWLRDSPSRNFFILSSGNISSSSNMSNFTAPYRIITSLGDNRFKVTYTGMSQSHKRNLINYAITLALQDAEYVATHDTIDFNRFLSYRSIIYEYSFSMPTEVFVEIFPENNALLTSKFEYFDSLIIAPSPNASNLVYFIFMDTKNDKAYEYALVRSGLHSMISEEIQSDHRNLSPYNIYYVSSKLVGLNFETNIFLPRWRGQKYNYKVTSIVNNHYETQPSLSSIGRSVDIFFNNPASVWQDNRDGIFTYSDENTVVTYLTNGTLNYVNYRQGNLETSLLADFDTALRFINKDVMVTNKIFLAGYKEEENKRIFYFDYIVNNFPIIFTDEFTKNTGLSHAIEVTVENGIVTRYKKIVYSFEVNNYEAQTMEIDLITVVNNIVGQNVKNISFGYHMTKDNNVHGNNTLSLEWVVSVQ